MKVSNANHKYNTNICNDTMTFEECELAILRHAVDEAEQNNKNVGINSEDIRKIYGILEKFIIHKKMIVYGGLALNRLMPKHAQFYNEDIDLPDYDMYTDNALKNAMELADIYHKEGYTDVEAKSGMHYGTFKVFVNFIGIADITQLHKGIYDNIKKEAVVIAGIHYCPPNFLRMSMYLELSRPAGDTSRWEKIYKRLTLLNKYYPLKTPFSCEKIKFQRELDTNSMKKYMENLYFIVRDNLIEQEVVFFGGYANLLYSKYMPDHKKSFLERIPDFDVLSNDIELTAMILKEKLKDSGFKDINEIKHPEIGEIIPEHIQITVGKDTIAFIYKPIACHSYNIMNLGNNKKVRVATIDTMLNFYLAFLYVDLPYYSIDRILCMAKYLFEIQQHNRLNQTGLLKRFNFDCIGKQPQLEDIRAEKAEMFKKLMDKKGSMEYNMWFLKYNPALSKKVLQHSNIPGSPLRSSIPKENNKNVTKNIKIISSKKKQSKKKKTQKHKRSVGVIQPFFQF